MPAQIRDKFTKLKVSRQRRYQLRKQRRGLCSACTCKVVKGSDVCVRHMLARRERGRVRCGATRRNYGARSYKLTAAVKAALPVQSVESKVA